MARPTCILIVDDDTEIRELLKDLVEPLGYRAELARDGFEALAKMKLDIDLVFLDLMMPGLDGYEVARRIRQDPDTCDVPILMLTALSNHEDRLRAMEAGANDFITKPADAVEIRARLTSLLKMKAAQEALKQHQREEEDTVRQRTASLHRALMDMAEAQRQAYMAHLDTLHRLALAAEYKDEGTGAHIQRIGSYAALLARQLNLPPKDVELVRLASPLHDVGKVGIPDAILLKPGKLTEEERRRVEQHTVIGGHILSGSSSDVLRAAEVIAMTHHERWDGRGYPNRLADEGIPLWGRICAVADVFDALTTVRPYKPAFSNEQSLMILWEESGTHFDPRLIELFFQHLDEVMAIQVQYQEIEANTRSERK